MAIAHDSRIKGELFCREAARGAGCQRHHGLPLSPSWSPPPPCPSPCRYLRLRRGHLRHRQPQPRQVQRLQGLRRRRLPDHPGSRRHGAGCHRTASTPSTASGARRDFEEAVAARAASRYIGDECLDDFVDAVLGPAPPATTPADLKLVYTPLNGAGLELRAAAAGPHRRHRTSPWCPSRRSPTATSPPAPIPTPRSGRPCRQGLELCEKVQPDLLLGTDPDCDRMGAAVPDGKGGYRLHHRQRDGRAAARLHLPRPHGQRHHAQGPRGRDHHRLHRHGRRPWPRKYGVELRRVPHRLQVHRRADRPAGEPRATPSAIIFGFEESYGYLSGAHVRDKDAVNAVML